MVNPAKKINIVLKIGLSLLILHVLAFVDELSQYDGKNMISRSVGYTAAALATYVGWRIYKSKYTKTPTQYPHFVDACITFVVFFDLLGNALDLYDSIWWWDDLMHIVIIAPWVMAAGYFLRKVDSRNWIVVGLLVAYGSVSSIAWESFEYFSWLQNQQNAYYAGYRDTIGDLILSLFGTFLGALLTVLILKKPAKIYLHDN